MVSNINFTKLLMLQEDVIDTHKKIGKALVKIEPYILLNEKQLRSIEKGMGNMFAFTPTKKKTHESTKKQLGSLKSLDTARSAHDDVCDMV